MTTTMALEHAPADPAQDRLLVIMFRLLAFGFATAGLLFLVVPNGTIETIGWFGSLVGEFKNPPPSEHRLWLSLAVGYMAVISLVAWQIQRAPRQHIDLMPILIVAKLGSSLTALTFYFTSSKVFAYLLTVYCDGSIAIAVLGCYGWLKLKREKKG